MILKRLANKVTELFNGNSAVLPDGQKDWTGTKFGKWTVLSRYGSDTEPSQWICEDETGTAIIASSKTIFLNAGLKAARLPGVEIAPRAELQKAPVGTPEHPEPSLATPHEVRPTVDVTGRRFGMLTAVRYVRHFRRHVWLCLCDCGKDTLVQPSNLLKGHAKSCGCSRGKWGTLGRNRIDRVGENFGLLTIRSRDSANAKGPARWSCDCECGKTRTVTYHRLASGEVTHCGCLTPAAPPKTPTHKAPKDVTSRAVNQPTQRAYTLRVSTHNGFRSVIDITGQRFGMLTVMRYVGPQSVGWLCRCDCGQEKLVKYINLQRGDTKTCGCASYSPQGRGRLRDYAQAVLIALSGQSLTEPAIRLVVGGEHQAVCRVIRELVMAGAVRREGMGLRGSPYLYTANSDRCAQSSPPVSPNMYYDYARTR